jgi:predicted permease
VKSAALTVCLPLSLSNTTTSVVAEGGERVRAADAPDTMITSVSPKYFTTMGIGIVDGRELTDRDEIDAPGVVVVNETLARRLFPGQDAVGQRIGLGGREPRLEIVGVARDGKYWSLGEDPKMFVYQPLAQSYSGSFTLVVRTFVEPETVIAAARGEVQTLDPRLPVFDVKTLDQHVSVSLFPLRVGAVILGAFGALALALAVIGLYGIMAYSVSQRTREIGIRIALGARPRDVLELVAGHGLLLTLAGIAVGLIVAVASTRFMSSLLYGISATDPVTVAGAVLVLAVVGLLACLVPARRAARIDPLRALRYE